MERSASDTIFERDRLLRAIRAWLSARGFVEVETPTLFRAPGLNPHISEFRVEGALPLWLRTSPEVFHKRLLAAGVPRLFEIGRFYRAGESTDRHNPEFTGLELYEANADYTRLMEIVEQLILAAIGKPKIVWNGVEVDLTPPWERLTVRDAFRKYADVDFPPDDLDAAFAAAASLGIPTAADDLYDDVFFRIYLEKIERNLGVGKPTFLLDWPASMGVMARRKKADPSVAERVELFIAGLELGNGFSELADPVEQRARFVEDRKLVAARLGVPEDSLPLDEAFLEALARMPPSTGIAIGLDRVLMLATGKTSIRDVIPFPFTS